jgi:lipopolysaccharide heptosyltransferase II
MDTNWQKAKNILCVRLDSLGDVLMTTPAIRAVKESIPNCHITLLTSPSAARVAPMITELDDVITYDAPWMKATNSRKNSQPDLKLIERLRRLNFDGAIIFTVFSQNPLPAALICFLSDIPLRLAHSRENPYQLLTHWVKEIEPETTIRHEVRRQLDLVKSIGFHTKNDSLLMRVAGKDQLMVLHKLREAGVNPEKPWVVIHPGATAPSRRYPPESFAEVARILSTQANIQVVFTGDQSECQLIESIQSMGGHSYSLAGKLTLSELAALLQKAPLLLSNNTGPVHIASAVGTPVVVLYALTNPQHTPWKVPNRVLNHDVPCKYCYKSICPELHHNCLRQVKPTFVVQAIQELLHENRNRLEEAHISL